MDELEMIKDMCPDYGTMCDKCNANGQCSIEYTAKSLINKNYRKIADDEIVIKADIKCVDSTTAVDVIEFFAKHNTKVRQETAREILQELKDRYVASYLLPTGLDLPAKRVRYAKITEDDIDELAKKHGIELE